MTNEQWAVKLVDEAAKAVRVAREQAAQAVSPNFQILHEALTHLDKARIALRSLT